MCLLADEAKDRDHSQNPVIRIFMHVVSKYGLIVNCLQFIVNTYKFRYSVKWGESTIVNIVNENFVTR